MHRRSEQRQPSLAERSFVVLVLLLSTGAFLNLRGRQNAADPDAGSFGMQALWSIIYLLTLVLLLKYSNRFWARLKTELWLTLIVALALCSTIWSGMPMLTLRRGIALVTTTLFGVYLADRYTLRQQLRLFAGAFAIAAVASIIFEVLHLGTAVDMGVPGWIGVYVQKGGLGNNMALAAVVMLTLRGSDDAYRGWATVGVVLSVVLLLLSQSVTSDIMLFTTFAMVPVCRTLRKSYRFIVLGCMVVIPLSIYGTIWVFHNLAEVTGAFGKDPSLTGRVPLWILSVVMALQKPWLGYGYNAFWHGWDGPSAAIWSVLAWGPPHSHNGLLEVWLGLGLVGVVIFLIGFLVYAKRAICYLRAIPGYEGRWPLIFLTLMFLSNLTGASILSRNTVLWIMYVATGMTTAQEHCEKSPVERT